MRLKTAGWVANSVDPDQTPRSAASDLGLHGLPMSISRSMYGHLCTQYIEKSYIWQLPKSGIIITKNKTSRWSREISVILYDSQCGDVKDCFPLYRVLFDGLSSQKVT